MDQNLRDALQRLSDAPRVGPDPVATDRVLSRVHRGRAIRVAAGSALAVVLVAGAAAAITLPRDGGHPIQGPTPTTTPSPAVTHSPTPQPTPSPSPTTPPAPAAPPSAVALTGAGNLVEIDPASGTVLRTVASDPNWHGPVALTPDRRFVYLTEQDNHDLSWKPDLVRVTMADGAVETVATLANQAAVSPDGTRLAYVADDDGVGNLAVMDLATGFVTTVGPPKGTSRERMLLNPTWTPDSASIIVEQGWADELPSVSLWEAVPGVTETLDECRRVDQDGADGLRHDWNAMSFAADGHLLAAADEGTQEQWDAMAAWVFGDGPGENLPTSVVTDVDTATGAVTTLFPVPGVAWAAAAGPAGPAGHEALVLSRERGMATAGVAALYRWDGSTLRHIGDGYLAVDW